MRSVTGIRLVAVLALFIGFSLAGAGRAAAGDQFSITIHSMECFSGVGSAIFEECHDDFDSSTATFDNGDGTVTLVIEDSALAGFLGAYVYCRDLTDDEVLFDGSYADGVVFPVEADDEIVCDVYFIKQASSGGSSSGGSEVTNTTTLPSTGTGITPDNQTAMLLASLLLVILAAFGVQLRRAPR